MRALGGGHERAIDRKRRDRLTAAGKETSDALAEWQVGAGALDRDHEDAGGLGSARREQAQVSARPMPAPNPRRRASRGWAPVAKVGAIRAI